VLSRSTEKHFIPDLEPADIVEILLKVALNTINQITIKLVFVASPLSKQH
jgi:hypothetical protein